MIFNIEVEISLKEGMLNPEAKTIENSLGLLGYKVENTDTINIITFQIEGENSAKVESEVDDMCQRILSNHVMYNYEKIKKENN